MVIAPGKIPSQHISVSLFSLNCYWTELYEEFIACKNMNKRNSLIWHTTKILCHQQEVRFDGIVTFESLRGLLLSVSETVLSTYNLVMSLCTCTKQLCQVTHFSSVLYVSPAHVMTSSECVDWLFCVFFSRCIHHLHCLAVLYNLQIICWLPLPFVLNL